MKIAAIDIGSNAARLLIVEVALNKQGSPEFDRLEYIRLPVRLGFDVFEYGKISEKKEQKFVIAMQAFQHLLAFYDVVHLKACATSAMRDADNSREIVKEVEKKTGIQIEVISGDEEALLVHETHIAETMDKEHSYLYIDVGGGSTDLALFVDGKLQYRKSFNIGTIRLIKNLVQKSTWDTMEAELKANVKSNLPMVAIGSGGNINKVFSLSKKKEGKALSLELLKKYYAELSSLPVQERMARFKLREDRADVIVPALQIYTNLMRWADITEIYIPKIGLVDGLVRALYRDVEASN